MSGENRLAALMGEAVAELEEELEIEKSVDAQPILPPKSSRRPPPAAGAGAGSGPSLSHTCRCLTLSLCLPVCVSLSTLRFLGVSARTGRLWGWFWWLLGGCWVGTGMVLRFEG